MKNIVNSLQKSATFSGHGSRQQGSTAHASHSGFTIIEVLIVLAIAGLILLIVFLAVPALQRNSRDSQRKRDASRVLGAAQEVLTTNSNQISAITTASITTAVGTYAYYTVGPTVTAMAAGVAAGSGLNANTTEQTTLYTAAICDGTTGKAISGTARQVAVTYKLESGGGTLQCANT